MAGQALLASVLCCLLLSSAAGHGHNGHHHKHGRSILGTQQPRNALGWKFGEDAINNFGQTVAEIARHQGMSPQAVVNLLRQDGDMAVDPNNNMLGAHCEGMVVDPARAAADQAANPAPAAPSDPLARRLLRTGATISVAAARQLHQAAGASAQAGDADPAAAQAFQLHSRPGAAKVIYLDFDGCTVSGSAWSSGTINNPAYDTDGNDLSFSNAELINIVEIWRGVAEDYAPFNVDVTTEKATYDATANANRQWTCLGGTSASWYCGGSVCAGGVAYVGVMGRSDVTYQPAWVFPKDLGSGYPKYVWEAASHEIGHNMGLSHDGKTDGTGYYDGAGGNWAPIMGVGYYAQLAQWSRGLYPLANMLQDDFAIISGKLGYVTPAFPTTIAGALDLTTPPASGTTWTNSVAGVMRSTGATKDTFKITVGAGALSLAVDVTGAGPSGRLRGNLNVELRLLDSNGAEVALANPNNSGQDYSLPASMSMASVAPGTYYVTVTGAGYGSPDGSGVYAIGNYPAEGSLGFYKLTVTGESYNSCPLGQYMDGSGNCQTCLGGASAPANAVGESSCVCPNGASRQYYLPTVGCQSCDATTTTGASPDGKTCTCNTAGGYLKWQPASGMCTDPGCTSSQWFNLTTQACVACAAGATAPAASTSETACVCGSGQYYTSTGCKACSDVSVDAASSTDGRSCVCNSNGQFDVNSFNAATGKCTRIKCNAGEYLTSSGTCGTCTGSTVNVTASTNGVICACAFLYQGFSSSTGTCSQVNCGSGNYITISGSTYACATCSTNAMSRIVATSPGTGDETTCTCTSTRTTTPVPFYRRTNDAPFPAAYTTGCTTCGVDTTGASPDGKTCSCSSTALTAGKVFHRGYGFCSCPRGKFLVGTSCTGTCTASTTAGAPQPTTMPSTTSAATDCFCPNSAGSNYFYSATTGCSVCPTDTYTTGTATADGKACTCKVSTVTGFTNVWSASSGKCIQQAVQTCFASGVTCSSNGQCCSGTCVSRTKKCK